MYRIGIIGTRSMGRTHSASYLALSRDHDVVVSAIAGKNPERLQVLAKEWPEAKLYTEGEELLDDESIDAVDLCIPTYLHAEFAIAAMEKGLNVFLEKPVCNSFSEIESLLETKKRTGVQVMVGQVCRFFPEYLFLKEAVDSGCYGKLNSLVMYRQNSSDRTAPRGFNDWYSNPILGGSVVMDLHVHDVDITRWILGEPNDYTVFAKESTPKYFEHIVTKYDYKDVFVVAEAVWDYVRSVPFEMAYRAGFDAATVMYNSSFSPTLKVYEGLSDISSPELFEGEPDDVKQLSGYYYQLRYFVEQCISQKPIEINSLEDAVNSTKLALMEYQRAVSNLSK